MMVKQSYPSELKALAKIPSTTKRASKKKQKDKPKRPLSAYNFFFKAERQRILAIVTAEDPEMVENDPDSKGYISDEVIGRLKRPDGKVSFEEMGKLIGQRWKMIDKESLATFTEQAAVDTERYKKQMKIYNGRQEAKMRGETKKPSSWNGGPGSSSSPGRGRSGDGFQGPGGYPGSAMYANYGNPGGMGGVPGGYNPYAGMDMNMPGAHGYGMGPGQPPMGMGGPMHPGQQYGGYGMGGDLSAGGASAGMPGGAYGLGGPGMYGMMGGGGGFPGGMPGFGGPSGSSGDQQGSGGDGRGSDGYQQYPEQAYQSYGSNPDNGGLGGQKPSDWAE